MMLDVNLNMMLLIEQNWVDCRIPNSFILMLIGISLSQLILLDLECLGEKKIIDFMFEHDLIYEDHIILYERFPFYMGP